jgi:hypothetical protein
MAAETTCCPECGGWPPSQLGRHCSRCHGAGVVWTESASRFLHHVAENRACPAHVRAEAETLLLAAPKPGR